MNGEQVQHTFWVASGNSARVTLRRKMDELLIPEMMAINELKLFSLRRC